MKAFEFVQIFRQVIQNYHIEDRVDQSLENPYKATGIEHLLYLKCWIDTVQWHYEDIIRDPQISPIDGMELKRKIDRSNQHRTDVVEQIDDYFVDLFQAVKPNLDAKLNTESLGWVIDRISILCLKIYHMEEQVNREEITDQLRAKCQDKLTILKEQEIDLTASFDELFEDIASGIKKIKVYRQMKMYNDKQLNPVLYKK